MTLFFKKYLLGTILLTIATSLYAQESLPDGIPPEAVQQAKENVKITSESDSLNSHSGVRRISGQVTASKSAEIGFRVQGFIKSLSAVTGSTLKSGDIIAKLDETDAQLQLSLAKAQASQAYASFSAAKKEMERERQLQAAQASSETTYDKIVSTYRQAQAASSLANINVKLAEKALERTTLVAPYDCIVSSFKKNEGEFVSAGTAVAKIHSIGSPEIKLKAPEQLLGSINVGRTLTISIPSIGFSGEAEVMRKVPVIDDTTRSFEVVAQLRNANEKVVPGLFAEARLD